jgi:hypothetical protein
MSAYYWLCLVVSSLFRFIVLYYVVYVLVLVLSCVGYFVIFFLCFAKRTTSHSA